MPRIPNTRPTLIYWLFDTRPETLIEWPNGRPFYCGKTVLRPSARFDKHRSDAKRCPVRAISKRLIECGQHVRLQIMETVSPNADWSARERYWILTLRTLYSGAVNITEGGQGSAGYIPSLETRAKRSASLRGRVFSLETRAKIGLASRNRSPEVYAKIGASQRNRTASPETRAKLSVAGKGKKRSEETRARMAAARKNRTPESYARAGAKLKGRVFSAETIAKMSASQKQRYRHTGNANA
jgi:hypothetical protein